MARKCVRYKMTRSGKRCAKYAGTKGYRGYGQPLKVYSGFGALNVGMDAFLPPLVGGGTALGTTLLLRAFVDPEVKDEAGGINADKTPHWAFKYAGLLGGVAGVVTSAILGPFQGWGASVAGGLTSLLAGGTAQLFNKVVPEDRQGYRGYGKYGLVAMQPRIYGNQGGMAGYGRFPITHSPVYSGMKGYGSKGYGAIGALPTQRRFAAPGRGPQSIPQSVLNVVNKSAFGGSPTLGTDF